MSGFSLKDHLFNREKVAYLAKLFASQNAEFSERAFVADVMKRLPSLELKQRIVLIAECLERHLPDDFPAAAAQITKSLPPPLDETKTDDDFGDFIIAPLGEYVVRNGLTREHLNLSLVTLKEITKRFSMEDAVRAFIRNFPSETVHVLSRWASDPNYHVRRLVSESTRPRLPWSGRIDLPFETTLSLLNTLHADPTRYVTRSVANHLNDIAKTHPDLVVKTLQAWREQARQQQSELQWMARHAVRTLIKRGHAESLSLLGFNPKPKISVGQISIARKKLSPGESLEFSFNVKALRDETLVIDYVIDFVKAGGKRASKVFKAAKLSLKKGETGAIRKKHKLHAQATTFKLYPGEHQLTIQVNGQSFGSIPFVILQA